MKRIAINVVLLLAVMSLFAFYPSEADGQSRRDRRRAEKLVSEGDEHYEDRNYDQAIVKYAQALAVVPQYPLAHYNKGSAHFNLQQYEESLREFGIALGQGYDPIAVYAIRWRAYFALKRLDEAMRDVQEAKRRSPNADYFYIAEGQVLHEQDEFQRALTSYQRALELGTKNTNVHYLMALSYNGLGDWVKQEDFARRSLESSTTMPDMAWFLLGDAQQRLRKYTDAVKSYQNAMSVNPNLYGIYINLAETFRVLNNLNEAITVAREGIGKYPDDATLQINISWYYSLSDRNALAIQHAKRAIELAPSQYLGFTNLCRAYNDTGDYDLALQNCRRALELQPGDGETLFYMGRTFQLKNDTDTAFDHYERAVKGLEVFARANPNYADGYYLLGNAYTVTGQNNKAISAYLAALEIAPLFGRARFNLGLVYLSEGEPDKARAQAEALRGIDAQLAKRLDDAIGK